MAGFVGDGLCMVVVGGRSWLLASCYLFKVERDTKEERERDIYE